MCFKAFQEVLGSLCCPAGVSGSSWGFRKASVGFKRSLSHFMLFQWVSAGFWECQGVSMGFEKV